ncbi:MAG: protein jag [Candidatus Poribacteria bacterium]|nr:protein jag [Candidatus Poribacteria bacterium]
MQQYIEMEGETTEEALNLALEELGVDRDLVNVKVLREPTKGILKLGAKPAQVRVTLKEDISATPEAVLDEIFSRMGIEARIESQIIDGSIHLAIRSDRPGLLIGRHGQTLDAIEHVLNCILSKSSLVKRKVYIDAEGYRERREQMLVDLASITAKKVRDTEEEVVLDPMPPRDRRVVHLALQPDKSVHTYSRGEGLMRYIVVTPREVPNGDSEENAAV